MINDELRALRVVAEAGVTPPSERYQHLVRAYRLKEYGAAVGIVWMAPDDMWREATGIEDGSGVLCPLCFSNKAEASDIGVIGWLPVPLDQWDALQGQELQAASLPLSRRSGPANHVCDDDCARFAPPMRPVGEAVRRMRAPYVTTPDSAEHDEWPGCAHSGCQPITERRMVGYYPPDHGHSHVETAGCADETGGRKPCAAEPAEEG